MVIRAAWARLRGRPAFLSASTRIHKHVGTAGYSTETSNHPGVRFVRDFTFYSFMMIPVLAVCTTVWDLFGEVYFIQGPSMYPLFNVERDRTTRRDVVLNWKLNAQHNLCRGMVVTFWSPFDPEKQVVKRIIGLEGDIIRTRPPYPVPTVRVPPGHIWVEGDGEARDSLDSNTYGPIATQLIIGRITHILLPLKRAGRVRWWEYQDTRRSRL